MDLSTYYHGLESTRLTFRKLTYDDVDSWMGFYDQNPNLEFLGIDLNRTRQEMAHAWIVAQLERYEKNEFGQLALVSKECGQLIGTTGFMIHESCQKGEVAQGIAIKPSFWNKGFGKEAATATIDCVFSNNLAEAILYVCHINNERSKSLSQSLQFEEIGIIEQATRMAVLSRLTKSNWAKSSDLYL